MEETVTKSFVNAVWSDLIVVSYAVPDQVLQPFLPPGLVLEHWQGHVYVSLVAFRFRRVRVQGLVAPAPFGDFPQWNLRFYVKPTQRPTVRNLLGDANQGGITPTEDQTRSEQIDRNQIKRNRIDRISLGPEERGIVFIREFVPSALVAATVHRLYNEPYQAAPLACRVTPVGELRRVRYDLDVAGQRHTLAVSGLGTPQVPRAGSAECFFTSPGWGCGVDRWGVATRFQVTHPPWRVFEVESYWISLDFGRLYGGAWRFLQDRPPDSVVFCEGSAVGVSQRLRV